MAKTLTDCITQIQTTITSISGVSDPGHAGLDSISDNIFAITEPASGEMAVDVIGKKLHDIRILVGCKIDDYPKNRTALIGLVESVHAALTSDLTLNGTAQAITGPITYTFGPTQHGSYPIYGAIFTVPVKIF